MSEAATKVVAVLFATGMLFVGLIAVANEREKTDISSNGEVEAFITAMSELGFPILVGGVVILGFLGIVAWALKAFGAL